MAAAGALERLTTSETIEWDALDGRWRLAYTNAADVLGLLIASQRLGGARGGGYFPKLRVRERDEHGDHERDSPERAVVVERGEGWRAGRRRTSRAGEF